MSSQGSEQHGGQSVHYFPSDDCAKHFTHSAKKLLFLYHMFLYHMFSFAIVIVLNAIYIFVLWEKKQNFKLSFSRKLNESVTRHPSSVINSFWNNYSAEMLSCINLQICTLFFVYYLLWIFSKMGRLMDEAGSIRLEKIWKKNYGKPCLSENTFLLWEVTLMSRREGTNHFWRLGMVK